MGTLQAGSLYKGKLLSFHSARGWGMQGGNDAPVMELTQAVLDKHLSEVLH